MTPSPPTAAYVDGSALLSIIFDERDGPATAQRLTQFTPLLSSTLLEAEIRAGLAREGWNYDPRFLSGIEWVFPIRSLGPEIAAALQVRYLRSGDLLHVATALYAVATLQLELTFITLDRNQLVAVAGLGFAT